MNIFLTGQKSFGKAVFLALREQGHNIIGVAPAPPQKYYDKLHGIALRYRVPITNNGEKLTSSDIPKNTDLIVSAHSHWFVSLKSLARARLGGIGYHPSLLPRHRGRDAVRWTIACGDRIAGGSVYRLGEKVDGGAVLVQHLQHVHKSWTHHDLWRELFPQGVKAVCEAVKNLEQGKVYEIEQDEQFATWEPSFSPHSRLFRGELLQLPPP